MDEGLPELEPCPEAIEHVALALAGWRHRSNYERWGGVADTTADAWKGERRIVKAMPIPTVEDEDEARPVQDWPDVRQRLKGLATA